MNCEPPPKIPSYILTVGDIEVVLTWDACQQCFVGQYQGHPITFGPPWNLVPPATNQNDSGASSS